MKEKFNIDQPKLKENPFSIPEGYFNFLENAVQERISDAPKAGWWSFVKPHLALATTFCFILLIGYGTLKIFTPDKTLNVSNPNTELLQENQLSSSFIDFYDEDLDSLTQSKKIDPDQIEEYLNTDASLLYLASLE